jgi:hypothetical protein
VATNSQLNPSVQQVYNGDSYYYGNVPAAAAGDNAYGSGVYGGSVSVPSGLAAGGAVAAAAAGAAPPYGGKKLYTIDEERGYDYSYRGPHHEEGSESEYEDEYDNNNGYQRVQQATTKTQESMYNNNNNNNNSNGGAATALKNGGTVKITGGYSIVKNLDGSAQNGASTNNGNNRTVTKQFSYENESPVTTSYQTTSTSYSSANRKVPNKPQDEYDADLQQQQQQQQNYQYYMQNQSSSSQPYTTTTTTKKTEYHHIKSDGELGDDEVYNSNPGSPRPSGDDYGDITHQLGPITSISERPATVTRQVVSSAGSGGNYVMEQSKKLVDLVNASPSLTDSSTKLGKNGKVTTTTVTTTTTSNSNKAVEQDLKNVGATVTKTVVKKVGDQVTSSTTEMKKLATGLTAIKN